MPQFQVNAFLERGNVTDIAVRQYMAWHRCKAVVSDGRGGVYLYKRVGAGTYQHHATAADLEKVRSSFGVNDAKT